MLCRPNLTAKSFWLKSNAEYLGPFHMGGSKRVNNGDTMRFVVNLNDFQRLWEVVGSEVLAAVARVGELLRPERRIVRPSRKMNTPQAR